MSQSLPLHVRHANHQAGGVAADPHLFVSPWLYRQLGVLRDDLVVHTVVRYKVNGKPHEFKFHTEKKMVAYAYPGVVAASELDPEKDLSITYKAGDVTGILAANAPVRLPSGIVPEFTVR